MLEKKLPERSCLACKSKKNKSEFLRIAKKDETYIFDKIGKMQTRGIYCCKNITCFEKLTKNKKINLDIDSKLEILSYIKKENKNLINALIAMKNSNELVFGINMILEEIKKINFLVIATDVNKKNNSRLLEKAKEYNIAYTYLSDKNKLGDIFLKDEVNVIGIKDKKMAKGLIK